MLAIAARFIGREKLMIMTYCIFHRTVELKSALAKQKRSRAEESNRMQKMADKHDCRPGCLQLAHALDALELERHVANSKDLVDEEDVRIDVNRGCEPEPHVLARRIELDRCVDELLEFSERDDLVEALSD